VSETVFDPTRELPRFTIRETRDRRAIDAALSEDRAFSGYALAHLEDSMFRRSRFWLAEGDSGSAVVLHANAMGQTLFASGDVAAIDAVLSLHPGPLFSYLTTCSPEILPVLRRSHAFTDVLHMNRMSVTSSAFEPAEGPAQQLRGADVRALNALYSVERAGTYSAQHLEQGVYFGAFREGRLVAAAGTHVVAPNVGIAIVGNVFTHPGHRGQGLAKLVTSRVTSELFSRGCTLVALTVDATNTPAVRAYARLGYRRGATVVEGRARRRDLFGLGAWLRRRSARHGEHRGERVEIATGRPPPVDHATDDKTTTDRTHGGDADSEAQR
jgi:ribosomal protein S18 acetylase RimI-like enzyme